MQQGQTAGDDRRMLVSTKRAHSQACRTGNFEETKKTILFLRFLNNIIICSIFSMFSSVEPASFRTKCHTAGELSRGRLQATTAECWFLPSERTRRQAERSISKKNKKLYYFYEFWIILLSVVYFQCFRALSQRLSERSVIPQAKAAGADRRRRPQNAGFYRASAVAGLPNGQLRKTKKDDMIFTYLE